MHEDNNKYIGKVYYKVLSYQSKAKGIAACLLIIFFSSIFYTKTEIYLNQNSRHKNQSRYNLQKHYKATRPLNIVKKKDHPEEHMEKVEDKYWPKLELEYDPIGVKLIDSTNKESYDAQASCKFPPLYCNHMCCLEQCATFTEIYTEWIVAHDRIRNQEIEIGQNNASIKQLQIEINLLRKNRAMENSDRLRMIQMRHHYNGLVAENKTVKLERDIAQKKIKELEQSLAGAESQIQSLLSTQETGGPFNFCK